MKKLKLVLPRNTLIVPVYISFCLVLSLLPSPRAFADANQLIITPTDSQMSKGTTFCVDVRSYADTDETTGTAIGTLNYTASKLKVTSILTNGKKCSGTTSAHYGVPSTSQSSGKISFDASRTPAAGGIAQVFAIKFKTIASGTATVSFASTSKVNNSTTAYKGGVYTITSPAPTSTKPPSTPTPITPIPDVSEPSATPTPTPDPSGFIEEIVIDALYTTATVTWKINNSGDKSTLIYGTTESSLDKTTKVTKKSGQFTTKIEELEPGQQYFFTISGTSSGEKATYSNVIYTRGFPIVLNITENNVAAANAQVRINNVSRSTDANGKLPLALAAGDYSGTITTNTATLNINFTVEQKTIPTNDTSPEIQTFPYNLTSSVLEQGPGSGFSILAFVGVLAVGTVLLGIGFVMFMAYRRKRFELDNTTRSVAPSIIIDDGYDWRKNMEEKQAPPPPAPTISNDLPPPPVHHNNSVYINDDEPVDMFAELDKPAQPAPPETKDNNKPDLTISH